MSLNALCSDGFGLSSDNDAVHLTNSVNFADSPRLSHAGFKQGQSSEELLCRVLHGQLLLCKVFVGQTAEARDSIK